LCRVQRLILDLSIRPIVAAFVFFMPTPGAVFVLDPAALPWRSLFLRRTLSGSMCRFTGREGLGQDVADFIGPPAIMLDDFVGHMAHVEAFSRGPRTKAAQVQPETFIWRIRRPLAMPGWDAVSVERLKSNKTSKGLDEKGRRSFSAAIWKTNLAASVPTARSCRVRKNSLPLIVQNLMTLWLEAQGPQLKQRLENASLYFRYLREEQAERFGRGLNHLFKTGSNDSGRSRLARFASEGTRSKK
jgi:hypothetical protein